MHVNKKNIIEDISHLKNDKYLRISNFLEEPFAEELYNCLKKDMDWDLACRLDNEPKKFISTNDVCNLGIDIQEKLKLQLNKKFQFVYNTYMMVTAYIENRNPSLHLNRVLEWLNTPYIIEYFRELTNNNSINKVNAQATRYLPGHFLTQHDDENLEEGRQYAYVIGMTKNWNPDWGGLLNILNKEGEIIKSLIPEYNSLSIFKVPQNHFVSYVTPNAECERISITGWLLNNN